MRRFWALAAGLTALLAAAMWLTLPTPLGVSLSHYNGSFLAALLLAGLAWKVLQRRRVATLAMAWTGAAATLTGFVMLYTRQLPSKEWMTWWHSFTSFLFLLAFLVHWWHNQPRLAEFTRRLFRPRPLAGLAVGAGWTAVLAAGVVTWGPGVGARFTSGNYLYLSSWAVLAGVAFAYGLWLVHRLPALQARLALTPHRNQARALVDTSLFLAHWAAILTGFALLYFAEPLRAGPLKYVSKWWHTATSVAFLALVALHVGFNARLVAAHARRVDKDLRGEDPAAPGPE